tara:strand:+ start:207 stop:812 length:606 start_codon:yes stop_codon:yes gene_type:complete
MKKTGFFLLALLVCATSFAGTELVERGSFAGSGESASAFIPLRQGSTIRDVSFSSSVQTNKSLTVYRPSIATKISKSNINTAVIVYAPKTNSFEHIGVGDSVLMKTPAGFIIVSAVTSNSGWYPNHLGVVLRIADNVTSTIGDELYIILGEDEFSIPLTTSSSSISYESMFIGFLNQPVFLEVDAGSGASTTISGTYDVEK